MMTPQDESSRPEGAETTPTRFVNAGEVSFAYRRFGNPGGSHDLIIPTVNAVRLEQRLPNAQLILYPDSGHGFLFQYHTLFCQHATLFLES
jgi:hypothetical protein